MLLSEAAAQLLNSCSAHQRAWRVAGSLAWYSKYTYLRSSHYMTHFCTQHCHGAGALRGRTSLSSNVRHCVGKRMHV
eukprot:3849520-Amphidinium_carterae.1